eukprot:975302_1
MNYMPLERTYANVSNLSLKRLRTILLSNQIAKGDNFLMLKIVRWWALRKVLTIRKAMVFNVKSQINPKKISFNAFMALRRMQPGLRITHKVVKQTFDVRSLKVKKHIVDGVLRTKRKRTKAFQGHSYVYDARSSAHTNRQIGAYTAPVAVFKPWSQEEIEPCQQTYSDYEENESDDASDGFDYVMLDRKEGDEGDEGVCLLSVFAV